MVNDENPMPCKSKAKQHSMKSQLNCFKSTSNDLPDEDSKDLAYVRKVLEFIDSHPTMFQKEKIYIGGN